MKSFLGTAFAIVSIAILYAAPAQAQATRTWVSGVGDDANPCSRTAPCKTFAGAISKTAPGGEINALDPGGFGAVTITKSISLIAEGVEGGVLVSGTNGIIVNVAATDRVLIQGLEIVGLGTGLNGIDIIGGGRTVIRKCLIRDFTGNGINVVGTTARAVIEDTFIRSNVGGLNIQGASNSMNAVILRNSFLDSNTTFTTQTTGASILILIGAEATQDTSTLVLNVCSSAAGANPVAIPFNYYFQAAGGAGNDVLSALNSALAAGLTLSAGNFPVNGLIIVEIDANELQAAGVTLGSNSYLQVVLGAPAAVDFAGIVAVLSGARMGAASSPSVTV